MKDNSKILNDFKNGATNLLDSISAFKPSIDAMEGLAAEDLDEESIKLVEQFKEEGKNIKSINELSALRDKFLQKLDDAGK